MAWDPYAYPVTCDVCGGGGMGTLKTSAAGWDPTRRIRHIDPTICAENLRRQRLALERDRAEVEQRQQPSLQEQQDLEVPPGMIRPGRGGGVA